MDLGHFSISLAVKDIKASRAFYEHLGFSKIAGDQDQNWLILKNGEAKVGLFQGMFEDNIITFNPLDARSIQAKLKAAGVEIEKAADEEGRGPTFLTLKDPDGNAILIDQHADTPS